jgi:hypothetical protein
MDCLIALQFSLLQLLTEGRICPVVGPYVETPRIIIITGATALSEPWPYSDF